MKRLILVLALMALSVTAADAQGRGGRGGGIFAPPSSPSGPIADVVNSIVTAFNNRDAAYFQKVIAPDAVWFDEDGHQLLATVWLNRLMTATPPRKLSITDLRVSNWDNAGWAGFHYTLEATNQVKGINTMSFRKVGNDWQIVMIHGAVDTLISSH
jgi:ketosteroid isomerase-like protein